MTSEKRVHTTKIACRWSDFDRFGHITNSAYIELAQEARTVMALEELTGADKQIPAVFVRKIEVDYMRPIMPDTQAATVDTYVSDIGSTSFTTTQHIKDAAGNICAEVKAVQVAIDLTTTTPRKITEAEKELLQKFSAGAA
ncbi:acyl-CoA thioesterase [Corynebacterium sp. sy017]|uniref:acyl-CoA thioesterase n=1 Tax=unclassified Corynebacterium TaxID=2624378 RepID=UPI001184E3B6|nr:MULTISPECIES: acyl-CoA thioesterase [unclassified Corynebacterium]MBP3088200.1 acyl-CoA thioesterase [Corynebacterium sp. sy017]QDZ43129.1 acyl-CoA thioesterase [Corynebacterium sp. sy039]TSD92702.1 acyl-CoA thioesterase [Corynebacterium sp. SY003]